MSIAQKLGYISVVETLKVVTETTITTTTTTTIEEKYRVVAPESMQETFMSDSEDEGGELLKKMCTYFKITFLSYRSSNLGCNFSLNSQQVTNFNVYLLPNMQISFKLKVL